MGNFFQNKNVKKVGSILMNVLLYAFMAVALFSVIMTIFSKKSDDGAATVFGYQLRFVRSDSMAKSDNSIDVSNFEIKDIPTKAMIFVEVKPEDKAERLEWYGEIQEGDVLTFRYRVPSGQETITHRVTEREEKKDANGAVIGYIFTLKGDNKASQDAELMEQTIDTTQDEDSFNYIIGKVTGQNYFLGFLVYALKSPVGIICIIIIPCVIIIGFEVAKIISVLNEDKKQRQAEEKAKNESEIEELKRKLAMFEQSLNANLGGGNDANAPAITPVETPTAAVENIQEESAVQTQVSEQIPVENDEEEK